MDNMTVYSKHMNLPDNKNEGKGIPGLEPIDNPSKVNLLSIRYIIYIEYLSSGQARLKSRNTCSKKN